MPRTAGWCLGRGNGKSSLAAAIALWQLMTGGEQANVDVVAYNETQAQIIGNLCTRMVERNADLSRRIRVYSDRLVLPATGSTLQVLPATPAALEGRNTILTVVDEIGRVNAEVWEVVSLAAGKRDESVTLGIGTPHGDDTVLERLRTYAREHPEDRYTVYREFSAAGYEHHAPDCDDHGDGPGTGCITLANPALADGFLHRSGILSCLPPKMSETAYRRARLCQNVTHESSPILPPGLWESLATCEGIADDTDVVLAFDGSYSGTDCTVLVAATVAKKPHLDVLGVWSRPPGAAEDWRVPVLEVEEAIRQACKRFKAREIVCDSYRWQRSLEVLDAEGYPVVDFPQNNSRMGPATGEFITACVNRQLSHSGHPVLAAHIANAVLSEDNRGARLVKASRSRHAGRIDAAVCAVMAHSRATHYANRPRRRYASFRG